jgi:serine/threonine protein kinase
MDCRANIKFANFGMAAWQTDTTGGLLQTTCGSPRYAAREEVMRQRMRRVGIGYLVMLGDYICAPCGAAAF